MEAIRRQYTWRNLYSQVAEFITHRCAICVEKQRVDLKQGVHAPRVLHDQGEVVYLDLLGPFSNQVSRARYLLSMMDGFSRYVVVVPVRSKSAADVSNAILDFWIKVYGAPRKFYADMGAEFTANLTQSMLNELGIPIRFAHPENHQANPVERFHQTLYAFVKSLRQEGENCLISGVRTAVMLYGFTVQCQHPFGPGGHP